MPEVRDSLVEELRNYDSSMPMTEKYDLVARAADRIDELTSVRRPAHIGLRVWHRVYERTQGCVAHDEGQRCCVDAYLGED